MRELKGAELLILTIKNAPGGNLTRGIKEANIN